MKLDRGRGLMSFLNKFHHLCNASVGSRLLPLYARELSATENLAPKKLPRSFWSVGRLEPSTMFPRVRKKCSFIATPPSSKVTHKSYFQHPWRQLWDLLPYSGKEIKVYDHFVKIITFFGSLIRQATIDDEERPRLHNMSLEENVLSCLAHNKECGIFISGKRLT